jgi:chemotaxis protein CheZ
MQYIGFNLNNNEYSIPVLKVREIIHAPPITKMPQSPSYIEGITNLRGNIIPVVNLKKLVGINFDDMIAFMDALAVHDYERANIAIQDIAKKGQDDLFQEIGKITRKLHDALNGFKEVIDPKFKEIATVAMPHAIDSLQFVIDRTEEATNKTLGIVEKYILMMDDLASHIRNIKEPEGSVKYLRYFKHNLEDDLTEILTTQSFQDITGQTIKKVIVLAGDLEKELMRLITTFGVKVEQVKTETNEPEKVSQAGVNDLLKEFGF